MQKYINSVADRHGNPVHGAVVSVTTFPAGLPATIYSDNGVTAIGSSVTTNANGAFSFYAADGRYTLTIANFGVTVSVIDVLIEDPVDGGFIQPGTGAVTRGIQAKLREFASIKDYGAVGDGVTDDTAAIQATINNHKKVFIPAGVYLVSAVTGILLRTGTEIVGDGSQNSLLVASDGGATSAQLVSYSRGSILKRAFNVAPGTNQYVTNIYLADFAVILTHPTASVTSTAIQIGIDLRNISRAVVERVHVGNVPPVGSAVSRSFISNYEIQGYGIVIGNVSSSASSYCGGEGNVIRNCAVYGARKCVVLDDGTLSPASAAHWTLVDRCDLQGAHDLLTQESQYATGNTFRDNSLQNVKKQPGDGSSAYVYRIEGVNMEVTGGYAEAGTNANYLLFAGSLSKNNVVRLTHYSALNAALITDTGAGNQVLYYKNTGSNVGGVDSLGGRIDLNNKAPMVATFKGYFTGATLTTVASNGVTLTRNGAGDYTIALATAQPNAHWIPSILLDTNASGHGGTFALQNSTQSTTGLRFYTYSQNAGSSVQEDPRMIYITINQAVA